jgi:hypothetical protein
VTTPIKTVDATSRSGHTALWDAFHQLPLPRRSTDTAPPKLLISSTNTNFINLEPRSCARSLACLEGAGQARWFAPPLGIPMRHALWIGSETPYAWTLPASLIEANVDNKHSSKIKWHQPIYL